MIERLVICCPACGRQHIDDGEWAERPHRTHLCSGCGCTWRPFEHHTVGVSYAESFLCPRWKEPHPHG